MRKLWITLAAVLAVLALVFAFKRDYDKAFVVAALGAVSWFLSYRTQMKEMADSADERDQEPQPPTKDEQRQESGDCDEHVLFSLRKKIGEQSVDCSPM